MDPLEDQIATEQEEKHKQLITLLRLAYRQEHRLSKSEQQEAISRVAEQLRKREEEQTLFTEKVSARAAKGLALQPPQRSLHQRRVMRVIGTAAAVLIVGALIGSAALLVGLSRLASTGTGRAGTPVPSSRTGTLIPTSSIDAKWDGLEMSMVVTPGPYFLGELVSVDLSLTNHTHPALTLWGKNDGSPISPCNSYSLSPEQTGGLSPHYSLYSEPVRFIYSCPDETVGPAFPPGGTITDHFYVLLTSSGDNTLTGVPFFSTPGKTSGPLAGHLPALHMYVASQVPADRMLSFQQQGSEVMVHGPANLHLVNQTYILCHVSSSDRGTPGGYNDWQMLSTLTLHRPACPDISGWSNGQRVTNRWTTVLWKYAVGAVGYEVIQGQSTASCSPC
jgi:hypothetical protein